MNRTGKLAQPQCYSIRVTQLKLLVLVATVFGAWQGKYRAQRATTTSDYIHRDVPTPALSHVGTIGMAPAHPHYICTELQGNLLSLRVGLNDSKTLTIPLQQRKRASIKHLRTENM